MNWPVPMPEPLPTAPRTLPSRSSFKSWPSRPVETQRSPCGSKATARHEIAHLRWSFCTCRPCHRPPGDTPRGRRSRHRHCVGSTAMPWAHAEFSRSDLVAVPLVDELAVAGPDAGCAPRRPCCPGAQLRIIGTFIAVALRDVDVAVRPRRRHPAAATTVFGPWLHPSRRACRARRGSSSNFPCGLIFITMPPLASVIQTLS